MRFRSEEEYEAYQDAKQEGRQLDAEKEIEDAWEQARDHCMEIARKECPSTDEDEIEDFAREIFEGELDLYIDPCKCSDPCCPCTGIKRGTP
jgi:hypothetical protein